MDTNTPEQSQPETSLGRLSASEKFADFLSVDMAPETGNQEAQEEPKAEIQEQHQESELDSESEDESEFDDLDDGFELEAETNDEEEHDDPWASVIEIGGHKRTAKEWHDGFLKNKDYTQKTQQLAEQRKAMEQREVGLSQLQEQSAMALGLLTKQAQAEVEQYRNVDWNKLLDADHTKYMKHKAKYDSAKEKLQNVHSQAQTFFQNIEQVNNQKLQQQAHECVKELEKDVKNWSDEYYGEILQYGVSRGINEQFLSQLTDPKLIKVLIKAQKYDNMRATAKKKKTAPRKVMNASRTGKSKVDPDARTKAIDRLKETRSRHDASDAFFELLKE